jgi:hypothetical protein
MDLNITMRYNKKMTGEVKSENNVAREGKK